MRIARFGQPREIAEAVAFLASPRTGYCQGTLLDIDGGQTRHAGLERRPDVTTIPRSGRGPLAAWLARCAAERQRPAARLRAPADGARRAAALHAVDSVGALTPDAIAGATEPLVPARLQRQFQAGDVIDLAFSKGELGRFRMNLHLERGRVAAAIRALPTAVPALSELGFSHDITSLARLPRGLLLVCGPTGSGKTTTVAAIVGEINANDDRHIVTIEDPVEYEHAHGRCVVEQVEIGVDAPSFPVALRSRPAAGAGRDRDRRDAGHRVDPDRGDARQRPGTWSSPPCTPPT